MTKPTPPPSNPPVAKQFKKQKPAETELYVPKGPRRLLWILYTLLVMAPWPIIGIVATNSMRVLDRTDEITFLFGGISLIFLIPLAFVIPMSDTAFGTLAYVIWGLSAVLPPVIVVRRATRLSPLIWMLGTLSAFSLVQALMGGLMLLTKSV